MRPTKTALTCAAVFTTCAVAVLGLRAQDVRLAPPVFPFGAVYFRKSNPPEQDWEKDHKQAAQMGVNMFRHWFMWASIENAPGKYDWADYDRMVELEGQNHINVIIAEITNGAPEWMWDKYPHARRIDETGAQGFPSEGGSSATASAPLCLDNDDVLQEAGKFLTAMVGHYKDKPAVMGYDVWNEGAVPSCYCPATQSKFRDWVKAKYGTLEAAAKAWHVYSLANWSDIKAPRGAAPYAINLDWLEFRRDDAIRLLKWRTELIRKADNRTKIVAHGTGTLSEISWRHAAEAESYGYTWVASRHGNAPWMQFQAIDLTRGAARGKPIWHAEATGGPLWMQPQVINRPLTDGRSSDDKDVRVWSMIDMAAGATGIIFTRWRGLLDGPLFGAFAPMAMDGSVTPQAEMASKLARWTNSHADLWKSRPVKGDVGIVFIQEAEDYNSLQGTGGGGEEGGRGGRGNAAPEAGPVGGGGGRGNAAGRGGRGGGGGGGGTVANAYTQSLQGAYQAFFDSNIQADFVSIDDIGQYPMIYVAYPVMLKKTTADKLRDYVAKGGKLVSEGTPGYFGDGARAGVVQPNLGLDQLFGARESYVEFNPDLVNNLTLTVKDRQIGGGYFIQEYSLAGGQAAGQYANGHIAAVEKTSGTGKTLLIGTFPAGNYYRNHSAGTREFFASLLPWAGVSQQVKSSDPEVKARLHKGAGGTYLWVINPTRTTKRVTLTLPTAVQKATDLWLESSNPTAAGTALTATVEDRNAAVIRLE
jgi:beta-galactosidase